MTQQKLAPVVAVLNMKGGVGKTTVTAHVIRVLYHRLHKDTLLIDLDPQFNLTQAVMTREAYEDLKKKDKTIFSVMEPPSDVGLFDIAEASGPPPAPSDLSSRLRYIKGKEKLALDLIPGDFRLVKYALISDFHKLNRVRERFRTFVAQARREYDLVCIDCNPSSSFFTVCALHACTHVLVPVRADRYSLLGLEILSDFVDQLADVHPKPAFIILLNDVSRYHATEEESELRGHSRFGPLVLANELAHTTLLQARSGYTGFATDRKAPWTGTLRAEIIALVDELATKLGLTA